MWENTFFVFVGILANSAAMLSVLESGLGTLIIHHKSFSAGGFSKQMKCILLNTAINFQPFHQLRLIEKMLP
jgi:hypothetical protein